MRNSLAVCILAVALSACGGTKWGFPYRADIQQGNWVTAEQVARLEQGMTREQVRYVLGTPTLKDIFHANRWDYPYYNKPGYGNAEERRFTVWFENDQLVRWEGDDQPDYQPFQVPDPDAPARQGVEAQPLAAPGAEGTQGTEGQDAQMPQQDQAVPIGLDTPSVLQPGATPNEPGPQPLR
ncbi:outer membrane protein assembly factor BamE [Pusillimonas noertemannii]|uniref:outer membrane protein assembly factor BamE n=1 Tax=Pusillimonas noertemannii TaxID=305977 RepID=UPI001FAF2BA4|nr:outer membrane protein assembly factor BamE [Pusillimonas noertemannii]